MPEDRAVVHVLLLKCRNRDARVREAAYNMLAAVPAATLHAVLKADEWRPVLDYSLGVTGEPAITGTLDMEGTIRHHMHGAAAQAAVF